MSGRNSKSTLPDNLKNGMNDHLNMRFTTYDRDQDSMKDKNCATYLASNYNGWWYGKCYKVHLNFKQSANTCQKIRIFWKVAVTLSIFAKYLKNSCTCTLFNSN